MRILDIRFTNLNSLVGHWHIDLTHPEFAREGIFAITGPTGAGKTTILDAICLALYGTTPRLGKVGGKSGNDLMSRHCAECDARVTFETSSGCYVSHWAQHRARRRPSGDLQSARHEVSEAGTGKILASSLKDSAALVLELTGMGFEQFSRSMMLAQGAFAAFLQARSEERAPILEQITGSEVYSKISIAVHERRAQEKSRFEALHAQLEGTQVLAPEARAALMHEVDALGAQVRTLHDQYQTVLQRFQTLQQLHEIGLKLQQHEQSRQELLQKQAVFAPDLLRLQTARRTDGIAPLYQALLQARQEQSTDQISLGTCQVKVPALEEAVHEARQHLGQCERLWQERRSRFDEIEPVLEKVRALDATLGQSRAQISSLTGAAAEAEQSLKTLALEQQALLARLTLAREKLERLRQELTRHSTDAELVGDLSGLKQALQGLADLDQQIERIRVSVQEGEVARGSAERAFEASERVRQETTRALQDLHDRINALRERSGALLEERSLTDWQSLHADLLARQSVCETAIEREHALSSVLSQTEKDRHDLLHAKARSEQLDMTVSQLETQVRLRQEQLEGLQQQLLLHRRIEDYAQARTHLHDGQPCPLCGALEHPYAQGVATESDNVLQRLRSCQDESERVGRILAAQQLERIQIGQQITQIEQQLARGAESVAHYQAERPALLRQLGVTHLPVDQPISEFLANIRMQLLQEIELVRERLSQAATLGRELQTLESQERESGLAAEQARAAVLKAEQQVANARFQLEQARNAHEQSAKARQTQEVSLAQRLAHYAVESEALASIETLIGQLDARRKAWLRLQNDYQDAQQQIPGIEQSLQFMQEKMDARQSALQSLSQQLLVLQEESGRVQTERQSLLQDQNPVQVHKALREAIDQARQASDQARERLVLEQTRLQQHSSRIESIREGLDKRAERIAEMDKRLTSLLVEYGFEDEAALRGALLTHEQRQAIESQERALLQEQSSIETTLKSLQVDRERLAALVQQGDVADALGEQLQAIDQQYRQHSEELGGLRQRILDDDRAKAEHASHLEQIEAQARELERWNNLHELIGSADGKKFRTFAQGLTFEIVIQHANQQLQRLTDRYLLTRGVQEPLELNVIDQYQAAEVRTTKNLSGGRAFW
ncbi:AAA family ATPase [Orrella marina]|uniref:AAA family ATPase n=1 Tax=Orrella marina TaxID=2163011 RepID=UPI00131ED9BE|nr:AAA family ATPase [Orrella marina]